jgi:hypothetical protein
MRTQLTPTIKIQTAGDSPRQNTTATTHMDQFDLDQWLASVHPSLTACAARLRDSYFDTPMLLKEVCLFPWSMGTAARATNY